MTKISEAKVKQIIKEEIEEAVSEYIPGSSGWKMRKAIKDLEGEGKPEKPKKEKSEEPAAKEQKE